MGDAEDVIRIANDWLSAGQRVCLATIVRREGSGPRDVGAKMAISSSGAVTGTVGGGAMEKHIIDRARQVISEGSPVLVEFDLSGRSSDLDAMCGGNISVFLEPLGQSKRLFVIGAGHVGKAVARLAREVGFSVTLVDDREDALKDMPAVAGAHTAVATPGDFRTLEIDESCFALICTRGHSVDKDWLRELALIRPRYLGMLGSKRKAKAIFDELQGGGIPPEALSHVHVPVGLDIKAVTPEEIAVSIVAELVLEWRSAKPTQGSG